MNAYVLAPPDTLVVSTAASKTGEGLIAVEIILLSEPTVLPLNRPAVLPDTSALKAIRATNDLIGIVSPKNDNNNMTK